jgi:hypothetical protein
MKAKLKTKNQRLVTRFSRETRFKPPLGEGRPNAHAAAFESLKERLLQGLLRPSESAWLEMPLRRAANDAAALAWSTSCPLLVLQLLLEEKAYLARKQAERQRQVLRRSRAIVLETP